jgi:site-specific recombinase
MLKRFRYFFAQIRRVREDDKRPTHINTLIADLDLKWPIDDKIEWLISLIRWIRFDDFSDLQLLGETGRWPKQRLYYFLKSLEKTPELRVKVSQTLIDIVSSISAMELFCETGLPKGKSVWAEFRVRIVQKLLPNPPLEDHFPTLLMAVFSDPADFVWLEDINDESARLLIDLFMFAPQSASRLEPLKKDLEEAILFLAIQVRALGVTNTIRERLEHSDLRESSFFNLAKLIEERCQQYLPLAAVKEVGITQAGRDLSPVIKSCFDELEIVHRHLVDRGVSLEIVFQVAVLREYLTRIQMLNTLLNTPVVQPRTVVSFAATLVKNVYQTQSLRQLWDQNSALMAAKIVERAAATGEHYIVRNRTEYIEMLKAAAGGGMVMAFAIYIKTFIYSVGFSDFVAGLISSLNYTLSFIIIQMAGYTLGTKQSAMTAPALAQKLGSLGASQTDLGDVVDEIVCIIRSQVASVVGNLLAVVPVALLLNLLFDMVFGFHLISMIKAQKAFQQNDILSLAPFYATFTGVLLWLSSLVSGWTDNWFAFHGMRNRLQRNRVFKKAFGKVGARQIAITSQRNLSGLAGNLVLGFSLGFIPEFMSFLGIPLDIRHVTVSGGSIAAAIPVLGWHILQSIEFLQVLLGVFFIGALNVTVSFSLAFWIAIKAKAVTPPQRALLYGAIRSRFRQKPLSFFVVRD